MAVVFFHNTVYITIIASALVAGPSISNTRAAPGDNHLNNKARAIGIEPVAHRYIGIDKSKMKNRLSIGLSAKDEKKSSGIYMVMIVATTIPSKSHFAKS